MAEAMTPVFLISENPTLHMHQSNSYTEITIIVIIVKIIWNDVDEKNFQQDNAIRKTIFIFIVKCFILFLTKKDMSTFYICK